MALVPGDSFEYTLLDDKTKTIIWRRTSEIKELMRLTSENIISIGQKLTEVKQHLGHGNFQSWLRAEFEWSEQTARQFMQVYRWSQTFENKNFVFSQLATSALYLLAAPSTPPEARTEVLNLVKVGKKVTYTQVKTIINRHKQLSLKNAIDVTAQTESQPDLASNQLFRLQTEKLDNIVRLYHAHELKRITDLTEGSSVKIEVGRWQGQTATIVEVLAEQQSIATNNPSKPQTLTQSNITVCSLNEADFPNLEKLTADPNSAIANRLIISYSDVCLAVEGSPKILKAFTERVKNNRAFVEDIFRQCSN